MAPEVPAFTIGISPTGTIRLSTNAASLSLVVQDRPVSIKRRVNQFDFDIASRPAIPRPLGAAGGTTILWLRGVDLRLQDAPALVAACSQHANVAPVYVFRGVEDIATIHSLRALREQFRALGGELYIRRGDSIEQVLTSLASRIRARVVHTTRGVKCDERSIIRQVEALLRERDIALVQHWDGFVQSPDTLPFTVENRPKTADEYYRKVEHVVVERPLASPENISSPSAIGEPGELPSLTVSKKSREQEYGENGAWKELNAFINGGRAIVNKKIGISYEKLNSHIELGCISARCVYLEVKRRLSRNSTKLHCAVMQLMLHDYFNFDHLATSPSKTKQSISSAPCK